MLNMPAIDRQPKASLPMLPRAAEGGAVKETKGLARHHREGSGAGVRRQRKNKLCGGYSFAKLVPAPPTEMCECGWPKGGEGCRLTHESREDPLT